MARREPEQDFEAQREIIIREMTYNDASSAHESFGMVGRLAGDGWVTIRRGSFSEQWMEQKWA